MTRTTGTRNSNIDYTTFGIDLCAYVSGRLHVKKVKIVIKSNSILRNAESQVHKQVVELAFQILSVYKCVKFTWKFKHMMLIYRSILEKKAIPSVQTKYLNKKIIISDKVNGKKLWKISSKI